MGRAKTQSQVLLTHTSEGRNSPNSLILFVLPSIYRHHLVESLRALCFSGPSNSSLSLISEVISVRALTHIADAPAIIASQFQNSSLVFVLLDLPDQPFRFGFLTQSLQVRILRDVSTHPGGYGL